MLKNVIITCSDEKYGDFVVNHWLASLKDNVNLKNIDVVVIDYGLTSKQKKSLKKNQVMVFRGMKKYHIVNKRFFDAGRFLKQNLYDQVLFIDGGDTIFQKDISCLFRENKTIFRVVPLGMEVLFFEWFISNNFEKGIKEKIWQVVKNKPVINAGVIFAPYKKFINLCLKMKKLIKDKDAWGPDQIVVNYYIYQSKYKFLDNKYNYMMSTMPKGFIIKNGVFYEPDGKKIAIVHNAGQIDLTRPIKNFGYGKKYNQIKHLIYHAKKTQYKILGWYKKTFS
ncbi:hypothetical protein COW98_00495 [Candidatus Roizmanbacteria bacterium CG22_combo_CG10-13_8_21_14_all_35_9]|uniref:Glycosyltransferase 2-like domain-containing protein n=4 Tax=Candidatus Roizmaniibacteriota TaxID=1752723 RepID=A0A2M8F269_9BACT|nr:MAG: hypothetical protein COX47_03045 [Candidatus Roizmanbacteria bacterium CG23_combo_of_CG06-09_8_20_14_all_35_49]PIP63091.1 MAG: hypothetical protein COW98_00495 [Candidatus Roizmanbacteria bacterium CG22_combo_CG10-13_8_21_14_all_35_9]PIY70918.1 MAG: hypothetical protein COY88_03110 [Candidatus Roizmanbacteria bacterium CG_4_10_14_0_8_um_filter_35_28]PJC33376.1 MAG: hypothetical protein CO048_03220 [Candidatus Roizmanbacteria bacterium CG_4_9_14_0_2_um_filter_35_15]PJC83183.1 MAG: hypoth